MQANEIRKKLAELYHLDEVVLELAKLGNQAVAPLGEYLADSPEVIPHARVAAVRTLGLIGTKSALEQLKKALFKHDLKNIDPVFAQSEYVVKNAIIEELLQKNPDNPSGDFLDAFQRYQLPAAIQAIVKYRILEAIPLLIAALGDDVLATRAKEGLQQLGDAAIPELLQTLSYLSGEIESRINRQRRIHAAIILGEIGNKIAKPTLKKMTEDSDPNLASAAAAALLRLDASAISLKESKILIKGALSSEWIVREHCRDAATHLGEVGIAAALELIHLESLPDLYGVPTKISESTKSWLVTYTIENAASSHFIDSLIAKCPQKLLNQGLWSVASGNAISNLLYLAQQNDQKTRCIVAHVLRRMHDVKTIEALIVLLGDWDRETAKEASESLAIFPKEILEKIVKNKVPFIRPIWKRFLIKMRLWWI